MKFDFKEYLSNKDHYNPENGSLTLIFQGVNDQDIKELIIPFLMEHTEIKILNLSENRISKDGAYYLSKINTILHLDISYNFIYNEGAEYLASNESLITINASENKIGDSGAEKFSLSKTIENINLDGNKITDKSAILLIENTSFKTISLEDNKISIELLEKLVKRNYLKKEKNEKEIIKQKEVPSLKYLSLLRLKQDNLQTLFNGYFINDKTPYQINLPRDLVLALLSDSANELVEHNIIDINWYDKESYKNHPFSLYMPTMESKKEKYFEVYNNWRKTINLKEVDTATRPEGNLNFRDILQFASFNKKTVVIGESHHHFTPKALLMHNIDFLREKHAVLFIESLRKELQDELNKSVHQNKPTTLIKAWLDTKKDKFKLGGYSEEELIKICIQEGIPLIACEGMASADYSFDNFVEFKNSVQHGSIERMMQNYEHFQAISYAKDTFPNRPFHICLIGDKHAYTYKSVSEHDDGIHPGIVDITDGLYIKAGDKKSEEKQWIEINKEELFFELGALGTINSKFREELEAFFFKKNNTICLANIPQILSHKKNGLNLSKEAQTISMSKIYDKYCAYIHPIQRMYNVDEIPGYRGSVKEGFYILATDPVEITEKEGLIRLTNILKDKESFKEYKKSVNSNAQDEDKNIFLRVACDQEKLGIELITLLIAKGSDPTILNDYADRIFNTGDAKLSLFLILQGFPIEKIVSNDNMHGFVRFLKNVDKEMQNRILLSIEQQIVEKFSDSFNKNLKSLPKSLKEKTPTLRLVVKHLKHENVTLFSTKPLLIDFFKKNISSPSMLIALSYNHINDIIDKIQTKNELKILPDTSN